jgi:uncharacterized protein (TIGR03437 family)
MVEADIDLEWAGAVARNATLIYVYGPNDGLATLYAIDNNLAPVISVSFGGCESLNAFVSAYYRSEAQKANSQGITWLASSGDSGAAGCDGSASIATQGLAVNFPASIPEVTAVGGTEFNDGTGGYWNATNGSNGGSAISYIPEMAWNDTALSVSAGYGLSATGGGTSSLYPKPAWQTGSGVPSDGARDLPDISLDGSNDHDPYNVLTGNIWGLYGGTSVSTPAFAGIVALLNHYLVVKGIQSRPGLGNINPTLYHLAQSAPNAFHDITVGNNIVPCMQGTPNCTTGQLGYSAGPGYDLATGLGSVDAYNLVTQWNSSPSIATRTTVTANPTSILTTANTILTATVSASTGSTTPTGSVSFTLGGTSLGTANLSSSSTAVTALLRVYGTQLAVGNNNITASYGGSTGFGVSAGSVTVTVTASTTSTTTTVTANPTSITASASTVLTATVRAASGSTTPTGSVSFMLGGTALGTANLTGSGGTATASLSVSGSRLTAGNNTITASYGGSTAFSASSGAVTVNLTGSVAVTTTTVTANPTSITAGGSTTLTATVKAASGSATPAGSVSFALGSTSLGSANLTGSGGTATASLTVNASRLTAGNNTITASYGGSTAFGASSGSVTVNVSVSTVVPSINSGGIVSGAGSNPGIARGSVASLYGTALADASAGAASVPLPRTLGNVQVSVNGGNAPLWYVSSGQINFQVPLEAPLQGQASVVVTKDGVASSPVTVALTPYAPSIFTYQRAAGVLDPVIVHATNNQLVTPASPAVPGEYLVIYGTGIGDLTVLPATGALSPGNPPANAKLTPAITIGGVNATVTFAGLTPDSVGLAQFNVQVPSNLPGGSALPLVINFNGAASVPVNLAVQSSKPTANVNLVFVPNPVNQSSDGYWYYDVQLLETSGVGVTLTKLLVAGTDISGSISTFFGSSRIPANGRLTGNVRTPCGRPCTPPYDYTWQFTGNDDNGHPGLTWTGVVHFIAPAVSGIGTVVSGLSAYAQGLAVDSTRNVYYGENNSIKRVSTSGTITVVAGNGTAGFSGDGGPATSAQLNSPRGVAVDQPGNIYIADYSNARIRKVDTHGTITTFAGNGQYATSGDGGPATSASFQELENVSVDTQGNVYVVSALTVRRIDKNGIIAAVAGDPSCTGGGFRGDGGPAPQACLYAPSGVAGSTSALYIADGLNDRIRKVDQNGIISTFAGNGSSGFTAAGGPALQVAIGMPNGIAVDPSGNVYFSNCLSPRIGMISSSTMMMTGVSGTGVAGFSGDNGAPNQAQLSCPTSLAFGPDGALYVLESGSQRIRRIVLVPSP